MKQVIRIGMDTSKHIFQLHGVDADALPVLHKRLRRKEMVLFFAKLPATVIGRRPAAQRITGREC